MLKLGEILLVVLCLGPCCAFSDSLPPVLKLSEFPSDVPVDSHPIRSLQGKKVHIRGFWYPITPNGGVLAATPHVKSCCLKAPAKIYQQVIVQGSTPSDGYQRAVTFEGIFKIEPLVNKEGEVIQYYVLEQAHEIRPTGTHHSAVMLSGLAGYFVVYLTILSTAQQG